MFCVPSAVAVPCLRELGVRVIESYSVFHFTLPAQQVRTVLSLLAGFWGKIIPFHIPFPCLIHRQIGGSTTLYRPHPPTPLGGTLFLYVRNADLSWISGYTPFCNFLNNVFREPSRESFLVLWQSVVNNTSTCTAVH